MGGDPCPGANKYASVDWKCYGMSAPNISSTMTASGTAAPGPASGPGPSPATMTASTPSPAPATMTAPAPGPGPASGPAVSPMTTFSGETYCYGQPINLTCPASQKLNIVNAFYGRNVNDTETCPTDGSVDQRTVASTCQSSDFLSRLQSKANDKTDVTFGTQTEWDHRDPSDIFGTDPCVGKYKYAKIQKECKS
jgi:hypothetical protein